MTTPAAETPPFWDPLLRLTHWGVAAAVIVNGLILSDGDLVHVWIGYVALALLAIRLIWGFVGPQEARFSSFPPSPSAALTHIHELRTGTHRVHRSHNPLGALMVYAIWATLAIVIGTGIALDSNPFPENGAIVQILGEDHDRDDEHDGGAGEEVFEELHEGSANFLLFLALLHVGGVAFEMFRGDRGIVARMALGQRANKG